MSFFTKILSFFSYNWTMQNSPIVKGIKEIFTNITDDELLKNIKVSVKFKGVLKEKFKHKKAHSSYKKIFYAFFSLLIYVIPILDIYFLGEINILSNFANVSLFVIYFAFILSSASLLLLLFSLASNQRSIKESVITDKGIFRLFYCKNKTFVGMIFDRIPLIGFCLLCLSFIAAGYFYHLFFIVFLRGMFSILLSGLKKGFFKTVDEYDISNYRDKNEDVYKEPVIISKKKRVKVL